MRSFPWQAGDKILYLNCAYGMVQSVLAYLVKLHAVELVSDFDLELGIPSRHSAYLHPGLNWPPPRVLSACICPRIVLT